MSEYASFLDAGGDFVELLPLFLGEASVAREAYLVEEFVKAMDVVLAVAEDAYHTVRLTSRPAVAAGIPVLPKPSGRVDAPS